MGNCCEELLWCHGARDGVVEPNLAAEQAKMLKADGLVGERVICSASKTIYTIFTIYIQYIHIVYIYIYVCIYIYILCIYIVYIYIYVYVYIYIQCIYIYITDGQYMVSMLRNAQNNWC